MPIFSQSEIRFDDTWIVLQLVRLPFHCDFTRFEHAAVVGNLKRCSRVLLDKQCRHARLPQRADDVENFLHDQRCESKARFVEHQQLRFAHQRASDSEHLTFAAGKRPGSLRAAFLQARKKLEYVIELNEIVALSRLLSRYTAENQIILDRHRGEKLALFRYEHIPRETRRSIATADTSSPR